MSEQRSRRQFLFQSGQLAAMSFMVGCSVSHSSTNLADLVDGLVLPDHPIGIRSEAESLRPSLPNEINPKLGGTSKSLDVQIGQMILAGFNGQMPTADTSIVRDVIESRIGSVALFGRNIASMEQVSRLTSTLQKNSEIPLLISVDQEGGQVSRLGSSFGLRTNYSAAQLGHLNDLSATNIFAEATAKTLRQVGINLNLAPVVDLNVNPTNPVIGSQGRSFSDDPEIVTAQALTFIQAHHKEGILCTLKHFPGHGSSASDSHLGFVDVTETWSENELAPFADVIRAGKCDVVMTAHIFNSNLDAKHPATLSRAVITGILRQRFGYDGVIMTDDIQMGAIRNYYKFEDAIELALDAGVDIFAISRYSPALVERVFSTIHMLVDTGRISEERIHDSFRRVLALKSRMYVGELSIVNVQGDEQKIEMQSPDDLSFPAGQVSKVQSSISLQPQDKSALHKSISNQPSKYLEELDKFLD